MPRRLGFAISLLALWLAVPAVAEAAQRYASPTGSGTTCSQAQPCSLREAIEGASASDEVIVGAGTYPSESTQISVNNVDIHGAAGAPPPLVRFSSNQGLLVAGGSVRDLRILHTVGTLNALVLFSGAVADRVQVLSEDGYGCAPFGGVITNSTCATDASTTSRAGVAMSSGGGTATSTLRNVTAKSASGGSAILVGSAGDAVLTLNAVNTIALSLGTNSDVMTWVTGTGAATVNLSYSNFDTTDSSLGGSITAPGTATDQTAAPLLVNAAGDDFHQLAASPTVDHGVTDALNGTLDFERQGRVNGASTDIGADEYYAPAPAPTPAALRLAVKPRRQTVDVGDTARFRAWVTNTGGSAASVVRVCIRHKPKALKGRRCKSIGTIAAGASVTRVFRLKAKPAAAGHRYRLRFRATATGVGAATATARLRVRP